jgi:hypothetical protein
VATSAKVIQLVIMGGDQDTRSVTTLLSLPVNQNRQQNV